MKSIAQLLRQPFKSITGILLFTVAVSVLCVGVGQAYASMKTQATFEEMFTTTAVTTTEYQIYDEIISVYPYVSIRHFSEHIPEEMQEWLAATIAENEQLIEAVATPGLASAYIPELTPSNYTQYIKKYSRYGNMLATPEGAPYSCAMLEITLTEVGEIVDEGEQATLFLIGTIENVIGLQEGFDDPTGYTARLTLVFPNTGVVSDLNLTIGDRYLVYGMDYCDAHWELASSLANSENNGIFMDLDYDKWYLYNEEELQDPLLTIDGAIGRYTFSDGQVPHQIWIKEEHMELYRTITLTLQDKGQFYDGSGRQEGLSEEEYRQRYTVPTIAHLEGTAEEFLASEDGSLWRQMLKNMKVNNHVFPVAGIQQMSYVTEFARDMAQISQGRDFTQEELESGAKVCILSNVIAESNGLQVGDTISTQFYNYDKHSPYQSFVEDDKNVIRPGAYFYSQHTPMVAEEQYTIVGIYEQDVVWRSLSEKWFSFSPNTIFVPESSVPSDMAYGKQGFFYSLILKNGTLEDFRQLETKAGYYGFLSYYDQGYATVSEGLQDYAALATLSLRTGIVVYAVVLLVFMLLYPGQERKNLLTMRSMGAKKWTKVSHVLTGSLGIVLPGTILGVACGRYLWIMSIHSILASEEITDFFSPKVSTLLGIGLLQLIFVTVCVLLIALWMSRDRVGLKKEG